MIGVGASRTGDVTRRYPAPPEVEVDRTWRNLGTVGAGTAVWVDFDRTDRQR